MSLRVRLLLGFLAFALVPIVTLTLFTLDQLDRSAQRWVRPGVEHALESGLGATRTGLSRLEGLALTRAQVWAAAWPKGTLDDRGREALREQVRASGLDWVQLYRRGPGGWEAVERIGAARRLDGGPPLGDRIAAALAGDPTLRGPQGALAAVAAVDSARVVAAGMWLPPEYFDQARAAGEGVSRYRQLGLLVPLQRRWVWLLLTALVAALGALAFLAATRVAAEMSRPLARLAAAIGRVAAGELETRVRPEGPPELRGLGEDFNRMTASLLEARSGLQQAEREAAWRGVARHLAHEIRNPLTPMRLSLHRLQRRLAAVPEAERAVVRESLDALVQEIDHLSRLADQFAQYARLPEPRLEPLDLAAVAGAAVALHEPGRVRLEPEPRPALPVRGDALLLSRAVHNLVLNALEAGGAAAPVQVRLSRTGGEAVLEVLDRGPGIAAEVRGRLFEPYVSTKRRGSGLGLTLVRDIAVRHGGGVTIEDREGGGACARLALPLDEEGGPTAARG